MSTGTWTKASTESDRRPVDYELFAAGPVGLSGRSRSSRSAGYAELGITAFSDARFHSGSACRSPCRPAGCPLAYGSKIADVQCGYRVAGRGRRGVRSTGPRLDVEEAGGLRGKRAWASVRTSLARSSCSSPSRRPSQKSRSRERT